MRNRDDRRRVPIEVRIEELVLYGFAPADRHRIGAVVERELARLFGERRLPARGTIALDEVQGGALTVEPGASARRAGKQIAQAVYGACVSAALPANYRAPAPLARRERRR